MKIWIGCKRLSFIRINDKICLTNPKNKAEPGSPAPLNGMS